MINLKVQSKIPKIHRLTKETTQYIKVTLWVFSFLKPYKVYFFLFISCFLFIVGCDLVIPQFIKILIDEIVPNKNIRYFVVLSVGLIAIIILMIFASMYKNKLQSIIAELTCKDIQQLIFQHLRRLGISYFERNSVGSILSIFQSEVAAVQNVYREYMAYIIKELLIVCICLPIMIKINYRLSLVLIPGFLFYSIFGSYFTGKAFKATRSLIESRKTFNKKIYDSISGLLEIRASNAYKKNLIQLMESHKIYNHHAVASNFLTYMRGFSRRIVMFFGAVFLFIYGSILVTRNELSIGEFVSFILYYFIVIESLTLLIIYATEQRLVLLQAEVIYNLININPDVQENCNLSKIPDQPTIKGEITFRDVYFSYPNRKCILNGIDFTIKAGEKVAIVGTTGHGKSTIIKLISRFYDPSEGNILIDGISIKTYPLDVLRDSIGVVFQETYLFGTSIKENILFGNPLATEEEMIASAKAALAHDFVMGLPEQYNTIIGERGMKLSGGQKQRISLARIFLKNPRVILLDEATSGLDNLTELAVKEQMEKHFRNNTVISIAHRLSTITNFDQIIVVHLGKVIEIGNYFKLINNRGMFFELVTASQNLEVKSE